MKSHVNKNPKFSPGDWITDGNITIQIEAVRNNCYLYCGDCALYSTKVADKVYHLWTINDAQNGDVLVNDFHMIFIFKEIKNNTCISSYSVIERENDVILNSIVETEIGDINLVNFLPATKEQRAILFKRMKEAGYEWNSQKKEFQNINFNEKFKNMLQKTYENMLNISNKESKFHIGDWIIYSNEEVHLITGFDDNGYFVDKECYISFNCEGNMRLWTIQDVQDGDVLVYNNGIVEIILLFKEWKNEHIGAADTYVHMFNNNIKISNWCDCSYAAHPATKEQRELLFKKIKKAGYEWHADKKELKKISEQHLISNYFNTKYERGKADALKSVIWNEKDEYNFKLTLRTIELDQGLSVKTIKKLHSWLKSLKQRCTWKPSLAQMNALSIVSKGNAPDDMEAIVSLYNDLKKLKG